MADVLNRCHSAFSYTVLYQRPGYDSFPVTAIPLPDDAPEAVFDAASLNLSFKAADFVEGKVTHELSSPDDRLTPMEDDEVTIPNGTVYRIGLDITQDAEGRISVHMRKKS